MGANLYYKRYIEKLINSNPTTIKIKRKVEIDDGFGGTIIEDIEVTETVAFYDRKARREVLTDYGTTYIGVAVTKILAKGNADIVKNDKFIVNGTEYKALSVEPYKDICKQIELEVVA